MKVKDLTNLFKWNTKVELKNTERKVIETLYVRLVGDIDYSHAQQCGLIESRKMRKRLKDTSTLDYQSLFLDLDEKEVGDLIFGITLAEMGNFRDLAVEELGTDILKLSELPDNPSLEDRENQLEAEESAESEKITLLRDKMDEKADERREELKKKTVKELRDIYVVSSTNVKCLEIFTVVFREYCVFVGTFRDPKFTQIAFDNFGEFRNASPSLKRQLTDAYLKLELTGDQLKN